MSIPDTTVAEAIAGDGSAFAALTEHHRRELHVHCYRMLASFDEAEDAVQETFLRAWRHRERFEGKLFRAWLYRISTNVCMDMIRRRSRQVPTLHSFAEVPWLQPYPDRLLDGVAPSDEQPEAVIVERETIELAFLAALQVLPPRQRAALIVRDVLGWPAGETASLLETSIAAANSALQRARATMQEHLPARRTKWSAREPSVEERRLLERFIDAHERCDAAAAVAIASEDIRITMPPNPFALRGARHDRAVARARVRRGEGGRLAPRADVGQPHADGRELPPSTGRLRVPGVQARRPAHRGRRHRRDHDVRPRAVSGLRPPAEALSTTGRRTSVASGTSTTVAAPWPDERRRRSTPRSTSSSRGRRTSSRRSSGRSTSTASIRISASSCRSSSRSSCDAHFRPAPASTTRSPDRARRSSRRTPSARDAVGCDISAFNCLLSDVKTAGYSLGELELALRGALEEARRRVDGDAPARRRGSRAWFAPRALAELLAYRAAVEQLTSRTATSRR